MGRVPLLLWACAVALGCRTAGSAAAGAPAPPPAGFHQHELRLPDGQTVRYTLFVPAELRTGRRAPLVLALHYGGRVTPFYGRNMLELLVQPALAELGAILVAPDALDRGWNDPLDERAVLALLDHLITQLPIDRRRVICTGYSMGGAGTWYLAARHPDRFAAAIPMAGHPATELDFKIPVYAIHGRRDEVVPLAPTEAYVARLRAAGGAAELVVVDGPTHYQTERFVQPLRAAVPWIRRVLGQPSPDQAGPPEDAFESGRE